MQIHGSLIISVSISSVSLVVIFVLPFPAQAELLVPSCFDLLLSFFPLTIDFCILVPTKSIESNLTINWLFGQLCYCRKWIWAIWDLELASHESALTARKLLPAPARYSSSIEETWMPREQETFWPLATPCNITVQHSTVWSPDL